MTRQEAKTLVKFLGSHLDELSELGKFLPVLGAYSKGEPFLYKSKLNREWIRASETDSFDFFRPFSEYKTLSYFPQSGELVWVSNTGGANPIEWRLRIFYEFKGGKYWCLKGSKTPLVFEDDFNKLEIFPWKYVKPVNLEDLKFPED